MSASNWGELGLALRSIHSLELPLELPSRIRKETYTSQWRKIVWSFLERLDAQVLVDSLAEKLAEYLMVKSDQILDLVERADRLAQALQIYPPDIVVCHSDVHPGNVLIDSHENIFIVDWDDPILAPKERDLMFIGGGQGFIGHTPEEEETLFYRTYGQTQINAIAMAYYRFERIIQDIAVECKQIFLSNEGGENREQALRFLKSNFQANGTIEIANKTYRDLRKK